MEGELESKKPNWRMNLAAKIRSNLQLCLIFVGIVLGFILAFPLRTADIDKKVKLCVSLIILT